MPGNAVQKEITAAANIIVDEKGQILLVQENPRPGYREIGGEVEFSRWREKTWRK